MKKMLFWILFFGFGIFSNAQSSLPKNISDSLWACWNNTANHDTTRLQAIHTFALDGYSKTKPDSAIFFLELEYDFAKKNQTKKFLMKSTISLGNIYLQKSNFEQATKYFSEAEELTIEMNDLIALSDVYLGLGIACKLRAEYVESISYYEKALQVSKEINDTFGISLVYHNLGVVYKTIGDFPKAIYFYNQSLQIKKLIGDKKAMAPTYNNIGHIYKAQGDYIRAMWYYSSSLAIENETQNINGIAAALNNMGILYMEQGDYTKAIELYEQARKLYSGIAGSAGLASVILNIGISFHEQNNFTSALEYYNLSLKMKEDIQDNKGIGSALNNIGTLYADLEDYPLAISYYFSSLKIKEKINDIPASIHSYNGLANCYFNMDSLDLAVEYCQKSLQIAIEIGEVNSEKTSYQILQRIFIKSGKFELAFHYLDKLIHLVKENLARNYFSMSEREKELYFATMEKDFGRYFDFTIYHGQNFESITDSAYNLILQTKGLTLKSSTLIRSTIMESQDSALMIKYENWILTKKKISTLYQKGEETTVLEAEADALEKDLIKGSGAFADFNKIKSLDWKQVRDGLKEGEAAVEFVYFKSEIDSLQPIVYAAFIVRKNSQHPIAVKLCSEDDLKNILGAFQGNNLSFVNKIYGTKDAAQTALYQKIWQPLEPFLKDIKTVYYSPSGLLHKVSFATICKEQDVYLSDVYNFRQMGSTGNLAFENKTEFGELENFLLMGGVDYQNESKKTNEVWSYLPGSLAESESINSFLLKKKFGVNYFKEGNASEEIFKEKITSSSIVHIATHGFFFPDPEQVREELKADSESNQELKFRGTTNYANWSFVNNKNPLMRSGIVLAGANDVWERDALAEGEDGILTAQEVSNLDLRNTKLVVLSACETGLGDIKGSEGVFGLQRAFKMAGVKYLIMSLWQVPDKETSEFMILFYKNLVKLKDIPTAFQKTQKVMREKYDPYYWGAFVLIE